MKRTLVEVLLDLVSNFAMSVFKAIDKFPPTTNPKEMSQSRQRLSMKLFIKPIQKEITTYISTIYPVNNFIENSQNQRKVKWISAQKYDLFR